MSILDRDETLRRLKAMEAELKQLNALRSQREALEKEKRQISVREADFDTSHAERVRDQRDEARTQTLGKLKARNPWGILSLWLGIVGAIAIFLFVSMLLSPIPLVVGIVLCCVFKSISKKKYQRKYETAEAELNATYDALLEEAESEDRAAEEAYKKAVHDERKRKAEQIDPQLAELAEQEQAHREKLEEVRVLADQDLEEDPDLPGKMIRMITSYRADSIKECFQLIDAENERRQRAEEDRHRRMEEDRRRAEDDRRAEEERRRHMPGEVYVYVGEKHSYGYKPPRNNIIIDGQEYGPGGIPYKKITLQPGWHTISVMVQLYYGGDYHFPQSDTLQFELEGGGKKYFQFYLKDSPVVYGFERSSESALHRDP